MEYSQAAVEDWLTIAPPPRLAMCLYTARVHTSTPSWLTLMNFL
ncbi:Uncharacterised protein [Mycobacterium tuberculosis]|nr:Uncharacterised protein [Mycobacterium tuberculosis]